LYWFVIGRKHIGIGLVVVHRTLVVVVSIGLQYFATGLSSFGFGYCPAWRERDNALANDEACLRTAGSGAAKQL
jgi:hypothetical protein